jgi:hypothetical protein
LHYVAGHDDLSFSGLAAVDQTHYACTASKDRKSNGRIKSIVDSQHHSQLSISCWRSKASAPGHKYSGKEVTPELPCRNTIQPVPANDSAAVVAGKSEVFTMERPVHNMSNLFAQLGQPNDEAAIARFIETHSPLADNLQLHEAHFWSASQAGFLRQALVDDADWAEVTDQLSAKLRSPGH